MSIVLVWPPAGLGKVMATTLLAEGDEVRVIVPEAERAHYRDLDVHVAAGDPLDPDLVERASQGARTVVFADVSNKVGADLEVLIEAGRRARVERVIVTTTRRDRQVAEALQQEGGDHVYLLVGRGLLRKVPDEDVAAAVNAADDLAGELRLVVDLGTEQGWRALGLEPR